MPCRSSLRLRATLALTFFVMALGAMGLAPWVHSAAFELVCSVNGTRVVDVSGTATADSSTTHADHGDPGGHCPLCMPVGAPPSATAWDFTPVQPLAFVQQAIPTTYLAHLVGAPLPARGPPLLS